MIYCDNAATTKISDEVLEAMMPYLKENYGNASAIYSFGEKSRKAIEVARETIAIVINAEPEEIYFTSGATESNNWALAQFSKYSPILTSAFEHPSVDNMLNEMSTVHGCHVAKLLPRMNGVISKIDVERYIWKCYRSYGISPNISIMAVNNEIGTIQPIKEIGEICHSANLLFHTDATQAIGHIPIDVKKMNIDMMSFSGHKFHAPKGIGVLYANKKVNLDRFTFGGSQEHGRRAGTENVAAIVGMEAAIKTAYKNLRKQDKIRALRNMLWDILKGVYGVRLNGDLEMSVANILNISIDGCNGENMVLELDMRGICVSNGSACSSDSLKPSRTLKAIGLDDKTALNSIRISLGDDIDIKQIIVIANEMKEAIRKVRKI